MLRDLRPALTEDGIAVLVIGDVATDRGRAHARRRRPRRAGLGGAAAPEGFRLAGIADDDVHAHRKMTKLWGREAGRATQVDRILVLAATEAGRRRAIAGARLPIDWTWPPAPPLALRSRAQPLDGIRPYGEPARAAADGGLAQASPSLVVPTLAALRPVRPRSPSR